ncbi:Uncharacterised protein [Klebsiella pneumoniae]|nr:Uncharacterised protein [Klebsiella pneumoniae]
MRLLVLFCCLWLLPGVASAAPSVGEIRVVSETWTRYTQEDGRGVAWDLLRAVYEPAGVRLRIANEPYTRAVGLVVRGRRLGRRLPRGNRRSALSSLAL